MNALLLKATVRSVTLLAISIFLCAVFHKAALGLQDSTTANDQSSTIAEGHSFHGEAFNEGPRQAAHLMQGMPKINFPVSTENKDVQAFFNQGVGQLHGFWYYEAERSFRQAAALEPQLAIAYWGMAMANVENLKRARGFIKQAMDRRQSASRREQLYIDSFNEFCKSKTEDGKSISNKERAIKYTEALENIVLEFPQDIEAKAFLTGQLWINERSELPIVGYVAINALLQQIFDAEPLHPAHHYRIHLWDKKNAAQALHAAAMCGPSSPGIAHMWHMPGHIYSKLHRYHDACWQQEASARVDHAHMIRDRVMPDQIHNFAHNNEWLIRNMIKVGRANDAISLAKNMIELPRHTKYNSDKKSGSWKYGRERLFQTLFAFEMWDQLVALSTTDYLPDVPDQEELHLQWARYVGTANALRGDPGSSESILDSVRTAIKELHDELAKLKEKSAPSPSTDPASVANKVCQTDDQGTGGNKTNDSDVSTANGPNATDNSKEEKKEDAPTKKESDLESKESKESSEKSDQKAAEKKRADELKKLEQKIERHQKVVHTIQAAQLAAQERWFEAIEQGQKGEELDSLIAQWQLKSGNFEKASEIATRQVEKAPGEVLPLALQSWIEFQHGGIEAARESFEKLRAISESIDLQTAPLKRLEWLASASDANHDWRVALKPAADIGERPDLESLGPYCWKPYQLPEFKVQPIDGDPFSSQSISRPTIVIFYLGFGCLHCVEQLQAFSPKADEFSAAGLDLLAVSTESLEQLRTASSNYDKPITIPLFSDFTQTAFPSMKCYDDFEKLPLHGIFLVAPSQEPDQSLRVLWQDIGHEPFMDVEFVIKESKRLLKLQKAL